MDRGRLELPLMAASPAPAALRAEALDPEQLFRRHASYVAAIAHRLLGRDLDVDDTVQEVFLVAVRSAGTIRDPEAVKGWLGRITVRLARRRLRARRLKQALGFDQAPTYET